MNKRTPESKTSSRNELELDLKRIDRSLAQDSLAEFVRQAWPIVEPSTLLVWNWHLDALCEYLEAVAAGDVTRLIVNLPPRSGKSLIASVLFPAWVWITRPATRWLCASYSAGLSVKHSVDRRAVIGSHWYRRRWNVQLAGDQNQKAEFMNLARGHMIATSLSGTATGKGGDFIIADDLQNPEMAESTLERENVIRFFDETLSTRLDDPRHGRIIVIQQRTHQADLSGHLLAQGGWTHLCLPAEFERTRTINLPRSGREIVKAEGDLLWPERLGRAQLDAQKAQLGSYGYASQFQQNPVARGGNLFKEDWFGTFLESPKFDRIIQSWDTAYKTGNANDYSACVTIGLVRERRDGSTAIPGYYLVHAWHGRIEFADLKRRAVDFYKLWHPEAVLVEDSASGQSLLQELRSNTTLPIVGVKPESDKFTRATSVTPALEAGCFRLLDGAPWASFYLAEMTAFPGGAHDDLVDATVQALTYLRASQDPAMLILYRELAQQAGMPPPSADGRPLRNPCDRCGLEIVGSRIEQDPLKFHIDCHRLWENGQ